MNNKPISYKVEYHTQNHYENLVKNGHWQLLVLPQNNKLQIRTDYKSSSNLTISQFVTPHLFSGDCLTIQVKSHFKNFNLSIESRVNIKFSNPFNFEMKSPEEEKDIINGHKFTIKNAHFLYNHKLTDISSKSSSKFSTWDHQPLIEYCQQIMKELNSVMIFTSGETEVNTTAEEALDLGKGVCQDFAHIFTGLLRKQKIPARYVCGYLCQGKDYNGASQLHAWTECFIPGAGWIGMDPSNDLLTDHHYIKISHGRNYDDCTPIRGVLETGGSNMTSHQVKISQVQQ